MIESTKTAQYRSYRINLSESFSNSSYYIPEDFENAVLSHIIGNYSRQAICPLFLAIHGPMGNGKTYQTLRICEHYHIVPYYISGAQLSGSYESDSISGIQWNLDEALRAFRQNNEYSVFIIDDFHLSIASTEAGVGKTVNSQLLTGRLMNLADSAVHNQGNRIPFILCGNDFEHLYGPLTRDGRMDFYEWNPSIEEKKRIFTIFMEDILDGQKNRQMLSELVERYSDEPISFFTQLGQDLTKKSLVTYISEHRDNCIHIQDLIEGYKEDDLRKMDSNLLINRLQKLAESRHQNRNASHTVHEDRSGIHGSTPSWIESWRKRNGNEQD